MAEEDRKLSEKTTQDGRKKKNNENVFEYKTLQREFK